MRAPTRSPGLAVPRQLATPGATPRDKPPALIGIDWGTTSFRAFLTTADGTVLDAQHSASGILSVSDGQFRPVLDAAIAPWLATYGRLPVLMSGMIGSRQGWLEAPYVDCPARLADLAAALSKVPDFVSGTSGVAIVPGVVAYDTAGTPDVMRGEETQIFGALARHGETTGTFVLPGTHSKWVTVVDGAITSLATYMTGEVYAALKGHTILGRLMQDGEGSSAKTRADGFQRGLAASAAATGGPGALLRHIFSARTLGLFGELAPEAIADYLSGLLIGAEIRDAADDKAVVVVVVLGSDALARRYASAFGHLGIVPDDAAADCAAAGLAAIAKAAGIIEA